MYSKNRIFIEYRESPYWSYKFQGKVLVDFSKNRIFIKYGEILSMMDEVLRKGSSLL